MMAMKSTLFSKSTHFIQSQASYPTQSVESAPEVGSAFSHAYPDWKEGTYEMFKDWAAKQFGDTTSDDEAEVPVQYQKAKDIVFKRNKRGDLILPPMSEYRKVRQQQRIIRAYAGAVYSESIQPIFLSHLLRHIRGLHWQLNISIPLQSFCPKGPNNFFTRVCPRGFLLE